MSRIGLQIPCRPFEDLREPERGGPQAGHEGRGRPAQVVGREVLDPRGFSDAGRDPRHSLEVRPPAARASEDPL